MKLFAATQIQAWDSATLSAQGITSLELMERAATACCAWLVANYGTERPFIVFAGMGNNGGDGLAIARMLLQQGYAVLAFVAQHRAVFSADAGYNFSRLRTEFPDRVFEWKPGDQLSGIPADAIFIDALFGTGLSRSLSGFPAELVAWLNACSQKKIAIDLPSGLFADLPPESGQCILNAAVTLSFQQYKTSMLWPEGGRHCGEIHLLDIGLDRTFYTEEPCTQFTLTSDVVRQVFRPRQKFSNKGSYGTAQLIGGSYGMIGAMVLATEAAARVGCGKVHALVPECGYGIIQCSVPVAMCHTSGIHYLETITQANAVDAVGIGPGMGTSDKVAQAFFTFLKAATKPIVLDADALNLLSLYPECLSLIPKNSILTPHPKEFERLFGTVSSVLFRNQRALEIAKKYQLIIVAKDTHTFIALPDGRGYYNINGNAGMATAGAGDVLCGMIVGLLAQGYPPADAALMGVFLHGASGDIAVKTKAQESLLASDLFDGIHQAFRKFY
ncbi:MAG: NAD(P)H-hydrate dehydratase [Bacteroidetes bacterium]|nr:NAD(P)H-hydrate dehydratase [Bacteroidota bacterium]